MKARYAFVIIAAVSILIYANSLNNAFQYDDQVYLEENSNIKTIGLRDIFLNPSSLFAPNTTSGHYRPLVLLMHVMNYRIHGLTPRGYHIVNLAFHVGSAMLLYLIIKSISNLLPLTSNFYIALTAALIFAVHPFNSEAVNYITARSSLMSGFFYLLSFYFWVRFRGGKTEVRSKKLEIRSKMSVEGFSNFLPLTSYFYLASLLAFLFGILSKEIVITLPVVLWLYDLYFVHSGSARHSLFRTVINWRNYYSYIPFVLVVVLPVLILRIIYWGNVLPSFKRSPLIQIYTSFPVLVKHMRLFVFPAGLNIDHYSEIYNTFFTWPVAGSALILILYAGLAVFAYRSRSIEWRVVSFFMIWFFIVLIPTTLVTLNVIFQENRGYLAAIVFAVFAGVLLSKLFALHGGDARTDLKVCPYGKVEGSGGGNEGSRDRPSGLSFRQPPLYALVLTIIIVSLYGAGTVYRNSVWRNGITLWSDAIAKSPESPRAHTNLGTAYAGMGKNGKAAEHFLKALRFSDPGDRADLANIHYNLGAVYQQMGRDDMALEEYQQLIGLQPQDFRPHYNIGVIYQQKGELTDAAEAYRAALARNPSDFRSYHNLGLIFQGRGELSVAEGLYLKALSLNPDYSRSRFNLAVIYEESGRTELARREYITIIKRSPDYLAAYRNLGLIYEREGESGKAIRYYRYIAERNPGDSDIQARIRKIEMQLNNRQ
ncbi:MAG TPA: tetratricopeptide repeat protein [Nitrospirota bacterium]|nr:tetratricopeptide repeat protein [Nitrospirota bacterium]